MELRGGLLQTYNQVDNDRHITAITAIFVIPKEHYRQEAWEIEPRVFSAFSRNLAQ